MRVQSAIGRHFRPPTAHFSKSETVSGALHGLAETNEPSHAGANSGRPTPTASGSGVDAPASHTRLRTTEGMRRALARLRQPPWLPWSPSGRSWGSRIPGTRSRSWPSEAARDRRAAAAWSKRYDPLLRHEVEGVDGLGSLGYQVRAPGPQIDERRTRNMTRVAKGQSAPR